MCPELFEIPLIHLTIKSYGLMMVIGFLAAVTLIRRLSRDITPNPQFITNAALYSLIAGVLGARVFFVIHHLDLYKDRPLSIFAVWQGGLELLGGVVLAVAVILFFLLYHKLPIRRYLDILAVGLMLALAFGRIGCFLNGCCFGKPTSLPWAVRFPYGSFAYSSQVQADAKRNRPEPYMALPDEFFTFSYSNGSGVKVLKSYDALTIEQKQTLRENDKQRSLPVHPTELYASGYAAVLCLVLYLFWRRSQKAGRNKNKTRLFSKPGSTFGLMFILYGICRFLVEFIRDDNPFEISVLTISQIIGIALIILGAILLIIFDRMKPASVKS